MSGYKHSLPVLPVIFYSILLKLLITCMGNYFHTFLGVVLHNEFFEN